MIILFEGADCTGKTTLAKMVHENIPGSVYLHNGPKDNSVEHYLKQIEDGVGHDKPTTIIDRMWLSELIYGSIVRGEVTPDIIKVVRFFNLFSTVTVMCVRQDIAKHNAHFESMDREEYARSHIKQIIQTYYNVWYGMVEPMPNHILDLLAVCPMSRMRGCYQYDMDKQTPEQFTNWILRLYK